MKAANRATAKFILKADISRFYDSIYSHSIPWALHGKAYAKAQRRNTGLLGNILDLRVRTGNDQQTIGVPVGPDSSLVIAEILLTEVDIFLARRLGGAPGLRYVDDYEFCFSELADAEDALAALQEGLSEYELALNPLKTSILELPHDLQSPWVRELGRFSFSSTNRQAQANDLIAYFDRAAILSKDHPQDHVMKYAIARLRSVRISSGNWARLQHLLLQTMTTEPITTEAVLEQFMIYRARGFRLDLRSLGRALNQLIVNEARVGHGNEVSWALWACVALRLQVRAQAAATMSTMEDSVVAILALHSRQLGLVRAGLSTSKWESYMTTDELYGTHWLLAYEANVKRWLPSRGRRDHVNADPNFHFLKRRNVQFYDVAKAVPMLPTGGALSASVAQLFSFPSIV